MTVNWDEIICFLWATSKGYNKYPITLHEFDIGGNSPKDYINVIRNFSM